MNYTPKQLNNIALVLEKHSDPNSEIGMLRIAELRNIRAIIVGIEEDDTDLEAIELIEQARDRIEELVIDSNGMGNHARYLTKK